MNIVILLVCISLSIGLTQGHALIVTIPIYFYVRKQTQYTETKKILTQNSKNWKNSFSGADKNGIHGKN